MIGDLLKQLLPALGRYLGYHANRIFRRAERQAPAASTSSANEVPLIEIGLDPGYERTVRWPSHRNNNLHAPELRADALYQIWTTTPNGHKWSHYFDIYREVFGHLKAAPMRILEIGVWKGSSLQLWRRYFTHPDTVIVGIDIQPECIRFDAPADGIRVRIGSQADAAFLAGVVKEFGPFDLIIDDGSHRSSHMIASFNHLYLSGLKDTGIYFVEDLHANYWTSWRDSSKSFLDVCKELVEHMHAHYRAAPPEAFLVMQPSDQPMEALDVPRITTMIKEIRIFDSIVAIFKSRRANIPYYLTLDQ